MDIIRQAQDRFLSRKFGVFNHFLYGSPSDGLKEQAAYKPLNWDKCIADFDAAGIARRLHEAGAGYYFITVMQGSKYMLAPNAAYDRIAGTKPGEACPHRDVIADLIRELDKYDIDLCLYFTGDGPHLDPVIGPRFGYAEPRGQITMDFVEKWAEVLKEYSLRYGSGVKAWWIDGCYRQGFGYTDELQRPLYEAAKAGNPAALVALNDGVFPDYKKNYPGEEFVCGEYNDFEVLPSSRFIDGAQAHILAPLGCGKNGDEWSRWCSRGARRDGAYMADYVKKANAAGMPVTVDVFVNHECEWDEAQFEVLKTIGKQLGTAK